MLFTLRPTIATSIALALPLIACSTTERIPVGTAKTQQDRPAASTAHAAIEDPRLTFDALDTNHDGEIEHDELRAVFAVLDENDDGVIEADEDAYLVIDADLNEDGVVEAAEFNQLDLTKLGADLNGDGKISREEYDIYKNERVLGINSGIGQKRDRVTIDPDSQFSIFRF